MLSNFKLGFVFWFLSIFTGYIVSTSIFLKIFGFQNWFYFLNVSFSKQDIFGSLFVGFCFAFRDISQIIFSKSLGKESNILLQALLIIIICTGTIVLSDPLLKTAAVTAFTASLSTDLVIFNTCKSKNYGWKIMWSSTLAAMFDIVIFNILTSQIGIETNLILSSSDFLLKTFPSFIVACYLDRYLLLTKFKKEKL